MIDHPGNRIYFGDNLTVLQSLQGGLAGLIYIDPPFNTGKEQRRTEIRTLRTSNSDGGDRTGFAGRRYDTVKVGSQAYNDAFDDYLAFLEPRLREAYRVLSTHGSLYFHIDYREVHYCKVLLDTIFGRECFLNEIIWAYDYGARSRKKWPAKHDNILVYVKDPAHYTFNPDAIDRIAVHGPRPGRARKGGAGQAAHRHLVPHDRAHQQPRENWLSDPKAAKPAQANRGRHPPIRAIWCSISSQAAAPQARYASIWAGALYW